MQQQKKSLRDEFLNSPGEIHALWLGFCSAVINLRHEKLSPELQKDISQEYHYYLLGFFIARCFQVLGALVLGINVF